MARSWRDLFRLRSGDKKDQQDQQPLENIEGSGRSDPATETVDPRADETPSDVQEPLTQSEADALEEETVPEAEVPADDEEFVVDERPEEAPVVEAPVEEPPVEETLEAADEEELPVELTPAPEETEAAALGDTAVDEDEERAGWFGRLRQGMRRSRESFAGQLNAAFAEFRDVEDEEFWERVEEILITSDVGVTTTSKIVGQLEQEALQKNITDGAQLRKLLLENAARMLDKPIELDIAHKPAVILMVGVNGTGKTTTIGKLVSFLPGKVMLAAGDTFRAAAIEQLQTWGERGGVPVVSRERGADSAAVAHDAIQAARLAGSDVLIIDTAGRLHTKLNLMAELEKIRRTIERLQPGAPHEVLLTIDATTGQNGLRQAKMFAEATGVTGIVLTKLDGTAKGGIALAIADEIGVPIKLISVGEKAEDLHPFEAREFAQALFGEL